MIGQWKVITLSKAYKEGIKLMAHDAWIKDNQILCNYIQGNKDSDPRVGLSMQINTTSYVFEGVPDPKLNIITFCNPPGGCTVKLDGTSQHCQIAENVKEQFPSGCSFKKLKK